MRSERTGVDRARRCLLLRLGACGALVRLGVRDAQAGALLTGRPAPPATLVDLNGQRFSTPDLAGHVVILTFWATWCAPCRVELTLLSDYVTRHAAQGLTVLGFCLDGPERRADVLRIAQSLSFPVGLWATSSAPGYGRIWRLPVSFIIDRQGMLIGNGWKDRDPVLTVERLDNTVRPLLEQPS